MSERALACGGPCATPSLWDVQVQDGNPLVVTNFGLLTPGEAGWTLSCEESIGGLILHAGTIGRQTFVSTDLGLFEQAGAVCDWQPGPASERSAWLLNYLVTQTEDGNQPLHLALVYDAQLQQINLERAVGGPFEVVRALDETTSYRQLQASAGMQSVFVGGYATEGRTWSVTFSLDQGQTWQQATPAFEEPSRALYLRYVDSRHPEAALVLSQSTVGGADELWRFDSSNAELSQLLVLEDEQIVVGVTTKGDWLWVAARNAGRGSLYRGRRDTLELQRVVEAGPPFSCLAAVEADLYACVDDFTSSSEYILGVSSDDGATWRPRMTVKDLGQVAGCGPECSSTIDWLHGTYAEVPGTSNDASADESALEVPNDTGGCGVAHTFGSLARLSDGWLALIGGWFALTILRRSGKSHRSDKSRRCDKSHRSDKSHRGGGSRTGR